MNRHRLFAISIAVVLISGAYVGAGLFDSPKETPPDDAVDSPPEQSLIQPTDNGTLLWPYTSRSDAAAERTLAINVLIKGSPERTHRTLTDRDGLDFEEMEPGEKEADAETYQFNFSVTEVDWHDADGAIRYVYFEDERGGEWQTESYQLHNGEYLGQRDHIRAYEDPNDEWTAIQTHREYFDWFRLRHTVTDIDDSAVELEDEFLEEPFVEDVNRQYFGLSGGWSDGWISVINLLLLEFRYLFAVALLGSLVSASTREAVSELGTNFLQWAHENNSGFVLAGLVILLVLGVRTAGIGLEQLITDVSPQYIAGALYPALALGPPAVVVLLARRIEPIPAFWFATLGLGAAFTLDLLGVGQGVLPVRVVFHRVGLMLALGLFAFAVARYKRTETAFFEGEHALLIGVGLLAWVVGLVLPLVGLV